MGSEFAAAYFILLDSLTWVADGADARLALLHDRDAGGDGGWADNV